MNTVERAHKEMTRNDKRRIFLWVGISVLIIVLFLGAWYLEYRPGDPSATEGVVEGITVAEEYTEIAVRAKGLFAKTKVFRIGSDTRVLAYTGETAAVSDIMVGSKVSVKAEPYDGDVGIAWMVRIIGYPDPD